MILPAALAFWREAWLFGIVFLGVIGAGALWVALIGAF
jgi:hypothetical protein